MTMIPPNPAKENDIENGDTPSTMGSHPEQDNDEMSMSSSSMKEPAADEKQNLNDMMIAKEETKAVNRIRFMVVAVLIACTVFVACGVYFVMKRSEQDQFEQAFLGDASKVLEALGTILDISLGALDVLVVGTVSYANYSNSTWPFVTVPDFAARAAKIRSLTKATILDQYLVVNDTDELQPWNDYTEQNGKGWVDATLSAQAKDDTFQGLQLDDYYTLPLHNFDLVPRNGVNDSAPYFPTWQSYPIVPYYPPYNFDGTEYFGLTQAYPTLSELRQVVITNVGNLPNPEDPFSEETVAGYNEWIVDYVAPGYPYEEPSGEIYYPMFDNAADEVAISDSDRVGTLVAVLSMSFFWRELIQDILPPGSEGIVAVFENACNQTFTYQLDGPSAIYVGYGDQHDRQYDAWEQKSLLHELYEYASGSRQYTGLPLSDSFCPYTIRVYPSVTMEARFTSNAPWHMTVVAVSIFVFTSLVFFLYDILVERRQKKVMRTAIRSSAIVSSLFPSNVRSRLYEEREENTVPVESQKNQLKKFLNEGYGGGDSITKQPKSQPIADLFPDATVLFADIAGFTAWSSVRQPSQVFLLLETLYGGFDEIAMKRGVFKVETIGDSYVAVAGLPEARPDHAMVMARFSMDCRAKMAVLLESLSDTLGPDTQDLSMRFGLHSGPVTAGVLRGQKSRFQLFGDTVNTAARMESTGLKNLIQVSQATADELIKAGKGHWVTPREDEVIVKGKGRMQTYWAEPKVAAVTTTSISSSSTTKQDNDNDAAQTTTEN